MSIRDLDLNLLLVFEAIFLTGNVSHAARNLDLSQPAVSNALTRLRKQIDDPLFIRKGNGVTPTARAEAMIDPITVALRAIKQSIEPHSKFDPETSKRKFRLIVADPLEPLILPQLLNGADANSQITYESLAPQSYQIEEALLQDKSDLAVFLMPERIDGINSEPLLPMDLVVLARKGHPRVNGDTDSQELLQESYVNMIMDPKKMPNAAKSSFWQKLGLRVVLYVNKMSSIVQTVEVTDLVGIVPRVYAEYVAKHYALQIIDIKIPLNDQPFHLAWHKRNDKDHGVLWLREKIATAIKVLAGRSL